MNTITNIDQTGIKALLRERLEQPELYVGKPLMIWCANFHDGIQERIVREVLKEFNEDKDLDDKRWFKEVVIKNYPRTKADIIFDMIGPAFEDHKQVGLTIVDPGNALSWPPMYEIFKSLINTRTWKGVKAAKNVPMVSFLATKPGDGASPADFPEAEQYIFAPDFEEWETWANNQEAIPNYLTEFIKGDGSNIAYRWYNRFNEPEGCNYPSRWLSALARLRMGLKVSETERISDLDEGTLRYYLSQGIYPDLVDEFITYVKQNKI